MRLAMQIFGVFALQFHKFQTHLQERLHERIFLKTEETMVHAPISNGTHSVYILQNRRDGRERFNAADHLAFEADWADIVISSTLHMNYNNATNRLRCSIDTKKVSTVS